MLLISRVYQRKTLRLKDYIADKSWTSASAKKIPLPRTFDYYSLNRNSMNDSMNSNSTRAVAREKNMKENKNERNDGGKCLGLPVTG